MRAFWRHRKITNEEYELLYEVIGYMLQHSWYDGLDGKGWQLLNLLVREKYFKKLKNVSLHDVQAARLGITDIDAYGITLKGLWFYFLLKKNLL